MIVRKSFSELDSLKSGMRMGQTIWNFLNSREGLTAPGLNWLFYVEDDVFIDELTKYLLSLRAKPENKAQ